MTRKTVTAGTLAQSVEQRTENPCVPGSIPGGTTKKALILSGLFYFHNQIVVKIYFFFLFLKVGISKPVPIKNIKPVCS